MKAILKKDKCLAAIGERPAEVTDDSKWDEMDGNAIANLHLALADGVLSSLEEKKSAKEIWDHLARLYEARSLHNKFFLKRKFYALRMTESTLVTEHINNLNTLFSLLASLSCKIDSQERAEILLQSLPDSYDQVIINLTSNVLSDYLVFDDVVAANLEEENRRNNREDRQTSSRQVEALVVTRGRSMEPGSSGSHNHGKSKTGKKKNFKGFKCGKPGHFRKDCRGLNTSYLQGNVASTSEDGNALCCEATIANESRKRFADVWLFDTGATFHMTSRREWFHQYKPISGGGSVYSCNDHELKIIGIGSIMVKMHDGTVRTIRDVRHVEGLKKNLLSLGQLDDLGCKVEIQNKIMKIIKGALVLMRREKVAANLYQLKGEIMEEAEASVASHSPTHRVTITWHQKLGHMSEQGMKILVERKLLPDLTKVSLPFCEHCV
ncbi:gag-pol polyprotein [Tanacetum coccineum]